MPRKKAPPEVLRQRSLEALARHKHRLRTVPLVRAKVMLVSVRCTAKRLGLPFNLEASDFLPLPVVCPLLGIKLNYASSRRSADDNPSIDRIIPELGYVKGNVWIVSYRANRIKCDASLAELILLVSRLKSKLAPVRRTAEARQKMSNAAKRRYAEGRNNNLLGRNVKESPNAGVQGQGQDR